MTAGTLPGGAGPGLAQPSPAQSSAAVSSSASSLSTLGLLGRLVVVATLASLPVSLPFVLLAGLAQVALGGRAPLVTGELWAIAALVPAGYVLHEAGHLLAARALGVPAAQLRVGGSWRAVWVERPPLAPGWRVRSVVAAGPLVPLIAGVGVWLGAGSLAVTALPGLALAVQVLNLLPWAPDGRKLRRGRD